MEKEVIIQKDGIRKDIIKGYLNLLGISLDELKEASDYSELFSCNSMSNYIYKFNSSKHIGILEEENHSSYSTIQAKILVSVNDDIITIRCDKKKTYNYNYNSEWDANYYTYTADLECIIGSLMIDGNNLIILSGREEEQTLMDDNGNCKKKLKMISTIKDMDEINISAIPISKAFKLSGGIFEIDKIESKSSYKKEYR